MKVLLISADSKYIHSNPAIYSMKAYGDGRKSGSGGCEASCSDNVNICIAEYTINQPQQKVLADIHKHGADVIMLSCYIWNRGFISELLDDMAVTEPDAEVWLGGPEAAFDSRRMLEEHDNVRGIMIGEGEETFACLLSVYGKYEDAHDIRLNSVHISEALKTVDGILFRDDGGSIACTPPRRALDMDSLPFAYEGLSSFENRIIYYESSRGCPFSCSYCLSSSDKRLRFRSLEKVKPELKFFLDNNVPQVKFVDRTFNCDHDRTAEIWRFLRDNDNGVTNFHFEMAADILNDEELDILRSLRPGQVQLEIGVQTTNADTIEAIRRTMDFEKLCDNVKAVKAAKNVHLHLDLIAGLPYEDMDSFARSFNDVFDLRPHQLQLGFLKVLQGAPMACDCERYGIKHMNRPPYEVLETEWLSYDDIIELKAVEEMVEVYYNTGQFGRSLELMLGGFDSAFGMFKALGKWHLSRKLDMVNLSRNSRYENLLKFALDTAPDSAANRELPDEAQFREAVIIDYYSRENIKTRPAFLGDETVGREFAKEFYSREARRHKYLTGSELAVTDDPRVLRKHTHLEKTSGGYLLFDYTERDPLTNNAVITVI